MLRSKKLFILFPIYLLGLTFANAQLNLRIGEHFLQGKNIKKVTVTYDDHTIWALTTTGEVYYKPKIASDFIPYAHTTGEVVDDIAGYGEADMYFSILPKRLIQIKAGIKKIIPFADPEVTRINGIVIMSGRMKSIHTNPDYSLHFAHDRLAIATDKYLYRIFRNADTDERYDIYSQPNIDIRNFRIVKSGIKGVEFSSDYEYGPRCENSNRTSARQVDQAVYVGLVPLDPPFGNFNCTMFNYTPANPYQPDVNYSYFFWGTNTGLFIRHWGNCAYMGLNNPIANEQINTIEELFQANSLALSKFVLAASNTGLFYTEKAYAGGSPLYYLSPINEITFKKLPGLNAQVKNFVIDFQNNTPAGSLPAYDERFICEKEIWLATNDGVRLILPELDGTIYEEKVTARLSFNKTPEAETDEQVSFNLCGGENLEINTNLTENFNGSVSVFWTKDGTEIPEWAGKKSINVTEEGDYRAELLSLCEGIRIRSKVIRLKKQGSPQFTFNYPAVINLCEGETKMLSTEDKPGYSYQWFMNDNPIAGANTFRYEVNSSGVYHVSVSNCTGTFIPSSNVTINIPVLTAPVILSGKAGYCQGEVALLKAGNLQGYSTKWYKNGVEQTALQGQAEIDAAEPAVYEVALETPGGCEKRSPKFDLKIYPFPVISVTKTPMKNLCYGESTTLSVETIPGASYLWSNGATSPSITVNTSGQYFVEVTSEFDCMTKSEPVEVNIYNQILLAQPPESKICTISGDKVVLVSDAGYVRYTWNGTTSSENTFSVFKPGEYQLTVEDANGCKASSTYKVVAWCKEIAMPNAFSPNGDGVNDVWQIAGLENDPNVSIAIYNRYGVLIFRATGVRPFWDGKYKGADAPAGVYYYHIQSSSSNKALKGSITLIR